MSTLGRWFLDPLADLNGTKTVNQKLFSSSLMRFLVNDS